MPLTIVVAYTVNRVIGRDGGLPWHLPTDMRHFRELTSGGAVLMGRATYESIPDAFRPLPNRRNLVLSRNPAFVADGAEVFASLDAALRACDHDAAVIGGAATYAEALPLVTAVEATEIEGEVTGDAFFPALDAATWACVREGDRISEHDFHFRFRRYERRA